MLSVLCLGFQLPAAPLPTVPMRAITPTMNMLEKAKPKEKQSIGDKLWSINTANKMQMVKVGQKAKVRGRKLPKAVLEITQTRFKKKYPMKDMEVLWGALLACYGTEELATQAVKDNWQMINPSYSFCNTMLASRDVLYDMMGKEEALEVMVLNPAVLQCGPSLDTLGPDEIKGFANIRAIGKKIPENAVGPAIAIVIALVCSPLLIQNDPTGTLQNTVGVFVRPVVGILFAVLIEGSRLAIVGTIVKAKVAGDEKAKAAIEKAQANEKRRMGKSAFAR